MNFKLNALVAAALLAAAGSANAAISTSASGNGELFLAVYDTTAGYSFVGDMGIAMDSFDANLGQSFSLNSWSQWGSFQAAVGGNLDNAVFTVLATDSSGTAAGNDRMWVTTNTAISAADIGATKSNQLGSATNKADAVLGKLNTNSDVVGGDMNVVANGSAYSAAGSTTYWFDNIGTSLQNNLPFSVMVDANEVANFGLVATGGTQFSLTPIAYTEAAGQWSFQGGNLNYAVAAVPEADTYAMLLAGLGLVGFMARRRQMA